MRGAEVGAVRKDWRGRIRVALIYPNRYEAGMANLGFHQVYRLFNESDAYVCERAFLPDPGSPPVSLESRRRLLDFDILAFSLSFENDYPNIISLLEGARIPLRTADRGEDFPLVMAGGVACMLNPEPVAPFIDCFLIGEAEEILPAFMEFFADTSRKDLLSVLARDLPGVYVPSLYTVSYHEDGTLAAMTPAPGAPSRVPRVYVPDLAKVSTCSTVLTSGAAFSDSYLVEVSRGCPHGCRFCGAGFVYRPPRFRPPDLLRRCLEEGARVSSHVGLVGAAVSDLPDLEGLCRSAGDVRLSFSSLRADCLTESLVAALKSGGVKTATVAPEAGSQRMRDVINKGISEGDILSAVRNLVAGGIPNLKLYFMVGFPGETDQDIEELISLCRKVKDVFLEESRVLKRIGEITVSLNAFVPKPATPFQWAGMDDACPLETENETHSGGAQGSSQPHGSCGQSETGLHPGLPFPGGPQDW